MADDVEDADDDSPGHNIGIWTVEACIEAEADFSPASHALRGEPSAPDYAASQNLRLQHKPGNESSASADILEYSVRPLTLLSESSIDPPLRDGQPDDEEEDAEKKAVASNRWWRTRSVSPSADGSSRGFEV